MNRITVAVAQLWMHSNDIVYIRLDASRTGSMGVKEAEEVCDAVFHICEGKGVKMLTDTRGVLGNVETGARETIRHHPGLVSVRMAEAFVVDNLANKIIADFYIRFNRPDNPTRVFSDVKKALDWLEQIKIISHT
ncbi:MAG: hypothetical protein IT223_05455 [Crocinitomicaceae bacterium]|nr:hypothetical protein [Crocinitomicaceae bacterium]